MGKYWTQHAASENQEDCPFCRGPGISTDTLGRLQHYRCRDCGRQFSKHMGVEQQQISVFVFNTQILSVLVDGFANIASRFSSDPNKRNEQIKANYAAAQAVRQYVRLITDADNSLQREAGRLRAITTLDEPARRYRDEKTATFYKVHESVRAIQNGWNQI